jgi:hypothetical protein
VLVLAAFLVTFAFIRTSARLIRDPRITWWPGNVETHSGLHIHHLIWGIGLVLSSGFLAFSVDPEGPARDALAIGFGIGAGLMLDEFALALYLQDVYWARQGRASLDAVVVAATLASLVVVGAAPLDLHDGFGPGWIVATVAVLDLAASVLAILKGKPFVGLIGIFLPPVAFTGAVRLARPGSEWARRRYGTGSGKLRRATARDARWKPRRTAVLNRIGGAPSA